MRLTLALLLEGGAAAPLYARAARLTGSDGYRLAPGGALAHVTLAQFRGLAESRAALAPLLGVRTTVRPTEPYLWPGRGSHAGYTWAGVEVAATPELAQLRGRAVAFLAESGAELLTPEPWRAHITLARLRTPPNAPPRVELPEALPARAVLGASDDNGRLLRPLAPGGPGVL